MKSRKLDPTHLLVLLALAGCKPADAPSRNDGSNSLDVRSVNADGQPSSADLAIRDSFVSIADTGASSSDLTRTPDAFLASSDGQSNAGDGEAGSASCPVPENTAPEVAETVVSDPPPVAKGGTILPGTYYETTWVRYNGMAVPPSAGETYLHRQTASIDAGLQMAIAKRSLTTGQPIEYLLHLRQVYQATVDLDFSCPMVAQGLTYDYDVGPGTLTFYHADTYGPYSYTLTKQ